MKCEKCGSTKNLIHHHEKYLELHGKEKIIILCHSCHKKLHNRLRKEGKCNIPVKKLKKISNKSYVKKNKEYITFTETMMTNVQLQEMITYNKKSGSINYSSSFEANNGKKLWYHDVL